MISMGEMNRKAASYALGGAKIPHGISNPVIRNVDGCYRVCYFVYAVNREDIKRKMYSRPVEWLALDAQTGDLLGSYNCAEEDFSSQSFDQRYSLEDPKTAKPHEAYFSVMDALFDTVRASIVYGDAIDLDSYEGYMKKLLAITPQEYQVFYRDLSAVQE